MTTHRVAVAHYRPSDRQWHLLSQHLRGTGFLSRRFAKKIGLPNVGELMGLLHDLGKYSEAFQGYLISAISQNNPDLDMDNSGEPGRKGSIDHSTAGAQWIWKTLTASNDPVFGFAAQLIALCVASHHSGLIDCLTPDGVDRFSLRLSKTTVETHADEAWDVADTIVKTRIQSIIQSSELRAELLQFIAHLKSTGNIGKQSNIEQRMRLTLATRLVFSCLIAGDRIDTAHFSNPAGVRWRQGGRYKYWPQLIELLELHIKKLPQKYPIDAIRQSISSECRDAAMRPTGTYTLSVPTGGGKTLASLRFALHHAAQHGHDRIIYVTPFISIIEQNAEAVRQILERGDLNGMRRRIVLEHHSNLGAERQTYSDKILCDDWDAPVIFTTLVQFLDTLFGGGTRGVRRMHQLTNAVLVFDEVQTLPLRCVHLFNHALNFLTQVSNSTVVLCTATQPLFHQVNFKKGALKIAEQSELVSDADSLFNSLRRVEVLDKRKYPGWNAEELVDLASDLVETKHSCLLIVNTKYWARELNQKASLRFDPEEVFHLSTDMCPAHRRKVFYAVKERLNKQLRVFCISTQLIEAGVDISFNSVIRFMSGLDSIAQAAGRCNRHGDISIGQVYVVNPVKENLSMLPDIAEGALQAQVILDRFQKNRSDYDDDLLGRKAMNEYYQHYFFQRQSEMDYPLPLKKFYGASLLNLVSDNYYAIDIYRRQNKENYPHELYQAFHSAAREFRSIDTQTESVIVPYQDEGRELVLDLFERFGANVSVSKDYAAANELMRMAQQYTVNVYPHVLHKLKKNNAVVLLGDSSVYCLDAQFYDESCGLTAEAVNSNEVLIWDSM